MRGLGIKLALEVIETISSSTSSSSSASSSSSMFYLQSRSRLHREKILKSLYYFTIAVSVEG